MATQIHAFGPNGELSPGAEAALEGLGGGGGSGGTVTATDAPTAPAEGTSASYLVTSAVVWPAGLVWSTDPDGGTAPTITDAALVSLFTVDGTTYAVMGSTYPAVVVTPDPEDETPPTPGTLAASAITWESFTLTVTGASDETALHATPYAFSTDNGSTWTAWQTSPSRNMTGLAAETEYTCVHKVRDAALNVATGSSIAVETSAWVPTWTPADLPGLVGWFDASDAATITADGAGKVSQWDDKSGEGNHLLQANGTSQPTTGIATLNGRNVITFTSSHRMDSAAVSPWYSNGASLATSFRMTSASSFKYLVSAGSSLRVGVSEYWRLTGVSPSVLDSTIDGDNSPHSIIGVNDGASSSITIDGTTQTGTLTAGGFNTIRVGTEIGAEIGEVVVVDGSLSPTDRDNLAAYLKAKWGTP